MSPHQTGARRPGCSAFCAPQVFYDCRADSDALRVLLRGACPYFRICNVLDVTAALFAFKLFDEEDARAACPHMLLPLSLSNRAERPPDRCQ